MKKTCIGAVVFLLILICFFPTMAFGATKTDENIVMVQDQKTFYEKHGFARVSKEKVFGVGGLGADEECIKLMGKDVTGHGNWYTQTAWSGESNYLVIEFDIMLSSGTQDIFLATGGHTSITPTVAIDEICAKDVWGSFVAIFDLKQKTSDLY